MGCGDMSRPSNWHQLSSSTTTCVPGSGKSNFFTLRLMDLRFSTWRTGSNSQKAELLCVAGSLHCVVFCPSLFCHLLCWVFLNSDMEVTFPVEFSSKGDVSEPFHKLLIRDLEVTAVFTLETLFCFFPLQQPISTQQPFTIISKQELCAQTSLIRWCHQMCTQIRWAKMGFGCTKISFWMQLAS